MNNKQNLYYMRIFIVFAFLIFSLFQCIYSQTSPITFGAVSRADLETELYPAEKGAEAVVLCDYATAKVNDEFQIEFTRHVRIRIFKSTGLDQANIQIYYTRDDRISDLKAATYNLEDDKITTDEVGKKEFYVERVNSYRYSTRFSFPNVREGSVIEFIYKMRQEEIHSYKAFRFQRMIPVRHVEYFATIPGFFKYSINLNHNNMIQQQHATVQGYYNNIPTPFDQYRWTGNNLVPFEPEPMMPEGNEYLAGVDFALTRIDMPNGGYFAETPTYEKLYDKLLEYGQLSQINNTFLFAGKVKELTAGKNTLLEKSHAIYDYVQHHMKWNGYELMMTDESLIKAHREKTGTNAVINLMLVNMLRTAGITADPVILNTRENGKINTAVALPNEINYVVCIATIEGKDYLMDASDKFLPMGELPFKCLNGEGWLLSPNQGRWVKLLNKEKRSVLELYDLTLNEAGELTGHGDVSFSGYDALEIRELVHNEGEIGFREEKLSNYGDMTISNLKFYAMDSLQAPLRISFDIIFKHSLQTADQMIFFKPLNSIFGRYGNSWIKDERRFPIDAGCPVISTFKCVMHFPDTIKTVEFPKTMRINMPDNDAKFLFGITPGTDGITILAELDLRKTIFKTNEYSAVREFYTQVNRKCSEMIILKKTTDK
jgi:hypothetical protein